MKIAAGGSLSWGRGSECSMIADLNPPTCVLRGVRNSNKFDAPTWDSGQVK
jgi:hypothetical protein